MAGRSGSDGPPTRGDRALVALVILACGTFIATLLWLMLGVR